MSPVSVAYFPKCHVLNLRNVTTFLDPMLHVTIKALCRMSNLRNASVTLSILGVKGHYSVIIMG